MSKPYVGSFLAIPALLLAAALGGTAPGSPGPIQGAPEPSGPLSAGARLVRLTGSGKDLRALVQMNVLSHLSGADVAIYDAVAAPASGRERGLAHARVERGRPSLLTFERPVVEGIDNHLLFRVVGRQDSGGIEEVNVYLVVPLDESTAPTIDGPYIVYQGVPVGGVQQ